MPKNKKPTNKERTEKDVLEGIENELTTLSCNISDLNDSIIRLTQEMAKINNPKRPM